MTLLSECFPSADEAEANCGLLWMLDPQMEPRVHGPDSRGRYFVSWLEDIRGETEMRPERVTAPSDRLSDLRVVFTARDGSWSMAEFNWDGDGPVLGVRWNGDLTNPRDRGHPRSGPGAVPVWFVLPDALAELARAFLAIARMGQVVLGRADLTRRESEVADTATVVE